MQIKYLNFVLEIAHFDALYSRQKNSQAAKVTGQKRQTIIDQLLGPVCRSDLSSDKLDNVHGALVTIGTGSMER